jgi:hypothetical protein
MQTISLVTSRSTFLTSLDIRPTASEQVSQVSIIFSSSALPTKSAGNATRGFLSPYAPSNRPKHRFPQLGNARSADVGTRSSEVACSQPLIALRHCLLKQHMFVSWRPPYTSYNTHANASNILDSFFVVYSLYILSYSRSYFLELRFF